LILLYDGGGAGVTDSFDPALSDEDWSKLHQGTLQLLEARGHQEAVEILNALPFELRAGINYFHDEFCVLQAVVALDDYIESS